MNPYSQDYDQQGYYPPQGSPHGNAPTSPNVAAPQAQQQPVAPAPYGNASYYGQPQPPYQQPYGQPYQPYTPYYPSPYSMYPIGPTKAESNANTAKTLGILSLFLVPFIFSIIAIVLGTSAKKELMPGTPAYSSAQTGVVTGIISLCICGLLVFIRML
jgi:hypothetical protein